MDLLLHNGLGDFIICNSLIRIFCKQYDHINVFVVDHNFNSVNFMFRDIKNLNYIVWGHDKSVKFIGNITEENSDFYKWYINNISRGLHGLLNDEGVGSYNINDKKIIKITNQSLPFDQSFYQCVNIDFEKRWTDFYFERNLEEEKNVFYNILGLKDDEEFIFVHDDRSRGFSINESKIESSIKIIRPDNKDFSIFDYLYTIEKAKEVHCMNSSFICLIDTMQLNTGEKYYHRYIRGYNCDPTLKLKWKLID